MLLLLIISNVFAATTIAPESFEQLLKNAPQASALEIEARAAKAKQVSKISLFAPTLEAKAGVENFSLGTFRNRTQGYGGVEARINIFNSGQDLAKYNQLKHSGMRLQEEAKAKQGDQLATLYEYYFKALANDSKNKILEAAMVMNERHRALARRRLKAGLVTNTDLLDFNIYELKLKEALIQNRLAKFEIDAQTRSLLGLEKSSKLVWSKSDYFPPIKLEEAGSRTAKIMNYALKSSEAESYIANSWWKPRLDLVGSFSQLTQREEDYIFAKDRQERVLAIELTFELDLATSPWTSAKEARLQDQAMAQSLRHQLLSVKENIDYHQEAYTLYADQLEQVRAHTQIAKQHLKLTLEEYSRGVKSAPDVLSASERVIESELEQVEAELTLNHTKAQQLRLSHL